MSQPEKDHSLNGEGLFPRMYSRAGTGRGASDRVISTLLTRIFEGQLRPGERINANRLAKELEVSVVPVREALHLLAGEGVIELLPLKGARVRTLSSDEVAQWWEIFRAVCSVGIRAAAEQVARDPSKLNVIKSAADRVRNSESGTPQEILISLIELHADLHAAAETLFLDDALRRLQVTFWASFLPEYVPFDVYGKVYVRNYLRVADSIFAGDGEGAVAIWNYHVSWSIAVIKGARPDPDLPWSPGPGQV